MHWATRQAIDDMAYFLFVPDIYNQLKKTQTADYVPIFDINSTVHAMCDRDHVSITVKDYTSDYQHSYTIISVLKNGKVRVLFNPTGMFTDSEMSNFDVFTDEAELFQLSTVQDNFSVELEDIETFKRIQEKYFEPIIRQNSSTIW